MGTMVFQDSLWGSGGYGQCRICGRTLTNPISINRGIGPICSGRGYGKEQGGSTEMESDITDRHIPEPITEGIILKRDEHGVATNVPHLVTHHSPSGFEFGYGGSGPADLALNIVEVLLTRLGYDGERTDCYRGKCFRLAFQLHQEFKWTFIANVPRDGMTIPYEMVTDWVHERMPEPA